MSKETPSVDTLSLVIVNYRSWDKLNNCLTSLQTEASGAQFDVVVVDNQSNDGQLSTFEQRFPKVTFIEHSGNWGFASGCNRGAEAAKGEMLLFLNPDTEASPQTLSQLVEVKHSNSNVSLLSCRQVDEQGRNQKAFGHFPDIWTTFGITRAIALKLWPEKYPSAKNQLTALTQCDWISGSVVLISRQDFDKLGGWDEHFWMYSEDADLCLRAKQKGMGVYYEPSATIKHLHGGASRSSSETKALTKAEVIISKHYFASKHSKSLLKKAGNHFLVIVQRALPALLIGLILLPSKLGKSPHYSVSRAGHLVRFYQAWAQTKQTVSPRSIKHPTQTV